MSSNNMAEDWTYIPDPCSTRKFNNNCRYIRNGNKKGQHYSIDLMIASTIFIILFLFISSNWDKTRMTFQTIEKRSLLEETTKHSFDALVYNQGEPTHWDDGGPFSSIGIADSRSGFVDTQKISKLNAYNSTMYQQYKEDIGMVGPGYEFFMNITIYNQDMSLDSAYSIGYHGDCKEISSKTRIFPTTDKKYVYINFLGCEKE